MNMDLKLVYICVFVETLWYSTCASMEYAAELGENDFTSADKRTGMRPYPFPCNGYDNMPRCLHGGKGPRKTWTKSGRFCVCLCPYKWVGAECGFAVDAGMGKRDLNNLGYAPEDEDEKRNYGPWQVIEGKRNYGPWQVILKDNKRNYGPWQVIPEAEKRSLGPWQVIHNGASKRARPFPWEIMTEKRPYPWRIWDDDTSSNTQKASKRVYPWNAGAMQSSLQWKYPDGNVIQKRNVPWKILGTKFNVNKDGALIPSE